MPQIRGRRGRWLAALGAVVLLCGCGAADAVPSADVPTEFADRPTLPDCGRVRMGPGIAEPRGDGIACLDAALAAGAGAELVVDLTTAEGDPVTEYYRALPDDPGLEIFTDSRRDRFRGTEWSYARCPEASAWAAVGQCRYRDL